MTMEQEWLAKQARDELEVVRQLLNQSRQQLESALRLPLSSENVKGILTRQGPLIASNAQVKLKIQLALHMQHSVPQLSIVLDAIDRADMLMVLLTKQEVVELGVLLSTARKVLNLLHEVQDVLMRPNPGSVFPEKVRSIAQGIAADTYIVDGELILAVYTYQDVSGGGHQALSKIQVRVPDPGLMAFAAKVEVGLQRTEHVCVKLLSMKAAST